MERSTEELIRLAKQGDPEALNDLLAQNFHGLRAFVRLRAGRQVRSKESSTDLVQSVCREVLEDLQDFEYQNEGAFKKWLYTLALRKVIDRARYYRSEKRNMELETRLGFSGSEELDTQRLLLAYRGVFSPSQDAAAREEIERIEQAFERLSDENREVITLSKVVGLNYAEIAASMDKSEAAVRKMMSRALLQLARILGEPR